MSSEKEVEVVTLYLDGYTYSDIQVKVGISKGSISRIVNEARAKSPDLNDLRNLMESLSKSKLAIFDARAAVGFRSLLDESNISIDSLPSVIQLIKKYDKKTDEILVFGSHLFDLETATGKSYKEIVAEAEDATRRLSSIEARITTLQQMEKDLRTSIFDLTSLKTLQEDLTQRGMTPAQVIGLIEHDRRLYKLGFTLKAAEVLANELMRIDLNPIDAADQLADLLSENRTIKQEVAELRTRKAELAEEITVARTELESINKQLDLQKNMSEALKKNIDEGNKIYYEEKTQHEQQIQNLQHRQEELKARNKEYNDELESTTEKLDQTNKTIAKIEEEIVKKRPLATFSSLIEDPKRGLPTAILLETTLAYIQAFSTYLYEHPTAVSNYPQFIGLIDPLRRGLEDETRLTYSKTK